MVLHWGTILLGGGCRYRKLVLHSYPSMGTVAVSWGTIPPPSALALVHLIGNSCTGGSEATSVYPPPHRFFASSPDPAIFVASQGTLCVRRVCSAAASPATEPFPQKLVEKVKSGQFVEMRELLSCNISLLQQLDTVNMQCLPVLPGVLKPRLREVTTLPSWLYCFLAYMAIRSAPCCPHGACLPTVCPDCRRYHHRY